MQRVCKGYINRIYLRTWSKITKIKYYNNLYQDVLIKTTTSLPILTN